MTFHVIDISLTSKHGNTALTFPHTGYFGITPVVLAGTVHLRLHEEYREALPIRSVQIQLRCYERLTADGLFAGSREHVLWQALHTLWRPKAGTEEMPFPEGTWKHPFKVRIPAGVADHSSGCKSLREWRVKWRLEVLVNHKPIPGAGHRVGRAYPLDLQNHRTLAPAPPTPPLTTLCGTGWSAANVFLNPPDGSYGPQDTIPFSVTVRLNEPTSSVRKVIVVLERRVEVLDKTEDGPPHKTSRVSSIFHRGVSQRSHRSNEDGNMQTSHGRAITTTVMESELDVSPPRSDGSLWCIGSLTLPPRAHRWDLGETEQTDLVKVSFGIRVKATVKNRRLSSTKVVTSDLMPVVILGCTKEERAAACTAAEIQHSASTSSASSVVNPEDTGGCSEELKHKSRSSLYMLDPSSTDISLHNLTAPVKQVSILKNGTNVADPSTPHSASIKFTSPPSPYKRHRRTGSTSPGDSTSGKSSARTSRGSSLARSPGPASPTSTSTSLNAIDVGTLPSIQSLLRHHSPTPAPSLGEDSPRSTTVLSPPANSDAEEIQDYSLYGASSSTHDGFQLLNAKSWNPSDAHIHFQLPPSKPCRDDSRRLPSLDALGLGLPQVPDARSRSRPNTAPHPTTSFYSIPSNASRPRSSGSTGTFAFNVPQQYS